MTTLKSIALELLQKYEESETSVIWECSGDIEKSEKYLSAEVAKYRELIDKYAEQEPKTGHWILKRTFPSKLYDEYLNEYKCSECYREIRCTESQLVNYPYCHCGAKMVEPQESEE